MQPIVFSDGIYGDQRITNLKQKMKDSKPGPLKAIPQAPWNDALCCFLLPVETRENQVEKKE
jgi:hypothetical protein